MVHQCNFINQFAPEAVLTHILKKIFAFRFLRVLAADLSTRHSWCDINPDDVYTRIYFSEQSAQQTMNEFTLFVDICLIHLSNTCSFDVAAMNL